MTVTIYHNPACGTSRNTLAMIRQSGEEPEVIEYLKTPPDRARLIELIAAMAIPVRALLREKGTPYAELGLADPKWSDDAGVKAYREFFEKYLAGADITNTSYLTGYEQGMLLEQILRQCGNDLSRENVSRQAKSIKDFVLPTTLPGIRINTSATSNMVWTQMQLQRWNGASWDQFGDVLDASSE